MNLNDRPTDNRSISFSNPFANALSRNSSINFTGFTALGAPLPHPFLRRPQLCDTYFFKGHCLPTQKGGGLESLGTGFVASWLIAT
ncbi:MAG: hypothetical protein BKPUNTRY_001549 [Candidatus Fervidibacter sp.]